MKSNIILKFIFISSLLGACTLFAGTPNIKGKYEGIYNIDIKSRLGQLVAKSLKNPKWTLDFDKGEISIQNGRVSTLTLPSVQYKITGSKSLIDNNDGTYTFTSEFQAITLPITTPKVLVESVLEITQTANGLLIKTLDSDNDGILGSISSESGLDYSLILPKSIEVNWSGSAE